LLAGANFLLAQVKKEKEKYNKTTTKKP